jgi:hypothetical protein
MSGLLLEIVQCSKFPTRCTLADELARIDNECSCLVLDKSNKFPIFLFFNSNFDYFFWDSVNHDLLNTCRFKLFSLWEIELPS